MTPPSGPGADRRVWRAGWSDRISALLVQRRYRKALNALDKIIHNQQLELFTDTREDKRLAWLYRISLLRELRRPHEALAWSCLECELNPSNLAAVAIRDELKVTLGYQKAVQGADAPAPGDGHEWAGVAGMRELKAVLERDVLHAMRRPELYRRYGLTLPNGILLYGPPGCGKTHIARALSQAVDYGFKEVGPGDLASIYVHGTQEKIRELFDEAADSAPCILFLDELDAFVPTRGGFDVGHHYSSEVNEFLVQLNRCADKQILFVGATNRMDSIDPAVLRPGRLDKKILVGTPDPEARSEVLRLYLDGRPLSPDISCRELALVTERYTYAELEHVVNEAARSALTERADISQAHLLKALEENLPSLTAAQIRGYTDGAAG